MPGTREGDNVTPPPRASAIRQRLPRPQHQRLSAAAGPRYLGYIDGGMFILDISDKANPKRISQWTNSPPYNGFTHTVVPLFDRGLMLVTDESTEDNANDWPKLIWVLDAREETNLVPIATCPLPPIDKAFAAAAAASARTTSTRTCRCRRPGTPTRS